MTRVLEWHRRKLDEYAERSLEPPLWPLVWFVPDDASNLRLILEVVLSLLVVTVYAVLFVVLPLWGFVWLMTN